MTTKKQTNFMFQNNFYKLILSSCSRNSRPFIDQDVLYSEDDSLLFITLCSLLEIYRRFRGAYWLHHQVPRWNEYAPLKFRSTSTILLCAMSQKTAIFILAAVRILTLTFVTIFTKARQCNQSCNT
jgi:hypothetical protein